MFEGLFPVCAINRRSIHFMSQDTVLESCIVTLQTLHDVKCLDGRQNHKKHRLQHGLRSLPDTSTHDQQWN